MNVEIEFLGNEEIENVITCLHFCMDKVIFFGYRETIASHKKRTESFLKDHCGVKAVAFHEVPADDLNTILQVMRRVIREESGEDRKRFIDITGGEDLILVAFGMLTREFGAYMHYYDVTKDLLITLPDWAGDTIDSIVPQQGVRLDLKTYIEMKGGMIRNDPEIGMQALMKDEEFRKDSAKLIRISLAFAEYWNSFSNILTSKAKPDRDLRISCSKKSIRNALQNSVAFKKNPAVFDRILTVLGEEGLIRNLSISEDRYEFGIRNNMIRGCIWKAGLPLEIDMFYEEQPGSDDCMMSVYIDWDGLLYGEGPTDVINEIDVLSLTGNVTHFVSCKSGALSGPSALHALYELNAVAERFGGKYARKTLAITQAIGDAYMERAKEMGVEIRMIEADAKDRLKYQWNRG